MPPPLTKRPIVLAVGCAEDTLDDNALLEAFDAALGGLLRSFIRDERFKAKSGQTLVLATHGRLPAARLALLGLGKRAGITASRRCAPSPAAPPAWPTTRAPAGWPCLPPLGFLGPQPELSAVAERLVEGVLLGTYRFDKYLSEEKRTPLVAGRGLAAARRAAQPRRWPRPSRAPSAWPAPSPAPAIWSTSPAAT